MSKPQKPSIIEHLLGPFGDRLQQLDHIGNSFAKLKDDYHQLYKQCDTNKELIHDNIRGKERLISQLELYMNELEAKMRECDDCMAIIQDTEEFKLARADYEGILAETRAEKKYK